ncbi:MAG TPA: glycoside hydrolase domain-containing protein [Mycobacteriales bacterium]|nr:glycoside hydrolase domain-containing protein [Mycobacteriales bacterium]
MAIRYGVDFAGTRPAAQALRSAGRDFVVRYVSSPGRAKNITAAEATYWRQNGIDVAIVFETTAGRPLAGSAAGAADAASGRGQVIAAGGPADGGVIYFAVDVDTTTTAQRAAVASYLSAAAGVIGWDQVGVYGEYDVVDYVAAHTACRYFWQTYAWSGGRGPHPRAQLYQYSNGQRIGGVEVDFDQALADDFGQWGREKSVSLTADEHNWLRTVYVQVTGAVAVGQRDFQSTIESTLSGVQALINLTRSNSTVLGRAITNSEAAVLAAIAALPTSGLSMAEQEQILDATRKILTDNGIQVDDTALRDALATQLAPEPALPADAQQVAVPAPRTEDSPTPS